MAEWDLGVVSETRSNKRVCILLSNQKYIVDKDWRVTMTDDVNDDDVNVDDELDETDDELDDEGDEPDIEVEDVE